MYALEHIGRTDNPHKVSTSQLVGAAALSKTDDTNVTLTLGGTIATALLQAVSLTLGWTGLLAVGRGGTGVNSSTGSGSVVLSNTPALTTPNIGAASGTSLAVTGALTSSGTAGIGYATGAGGTVTQATSKSTGVTLNKICGQITMNNAALAANTLTAFTVTNSTVAGSDIVNLNHIGGGAVSNYFFWVQPGGGNFTVYVLNRTAGSLSDAIVLNYSVSKGVTA